MTIPPKVTSVTLLAVGLAAVTVGVYLAVNIGVALIVFGGLIIAGETLVP